MRFILLLSLILCILCPDIAYGQAFKDEEGFALTEAPPKWRKYPMVMLCAQHEYDLRSIGKCKETLRLRFIIQDGEVADQYANLFFGEKDEPEIKVIKGGGKVVKVDGRSYTRVKESEVNPALLFSLSRELPGGYLKVKMPKLEEGDIIDFVLEDKSNFNEVYSETKVILSETYPVVKRKISFRMSKIQEGIQRYVVMKFQSMNGAPQLKTVDETLYEVIDVNRAPRETASWKPPLSLLPAVKFNFFWNLVSNRYLLDAGTRVTTQLNESRLLNLLNSFQFAPGPSDPGLQAFLQKERGKGGMDNLEDVYQYHRYKLEPNKQASLNELAGWFAPVIEEGSQPVNLVAMLPLGADNLKETLFLSEVSLGLHTQSGGEDYFFFDMDKLSNPGDFSASLEGAKGYLLPLTTELTTKGTSVKVSGWKRSPVDLPESSAEENQVVISTTVDLSAISSADVERNLIVKGHSKKKYSYLIMGDDYEYEERDKFAIDGRPILPPPTDAELDARRTQRDQIAENELQSELGDGALRALILIQAGRSSESPELIFREVFSANELASPSGANLTFQAGKLIGEQEYFANDGRNRLSDVYLGYARSYVYQIEVILPDGYQALGLDKLSREEENDTGSFFSHAFQSDNILSITVSKVYPRRIIPREEWNDMLVWLDAAYQFSQTQIQLVKKNN